MDLASEEGIVEKSGAWYSFNGERIGQGREQAKEYLKEHPEVLRDIEAKVMEKYGIIRPPSPVGLLLHVHSLFNVLIQTRQVARAFACNSARHDQRGCSWRTQEVAQPTCSFAESSSNSSISFISYLWYRCEE